jgi:peptidoglycan biosynthesis protein MviN/MurJ (putative lipid II flippase)
VRRAAFVLLGWGAWLGALTALQLPFDPRGIELVMLGGAAAACLSCGLVLWTLERRRSGPPAEVALAPRSSVAAATLACGGALALLGAGFGLWLILIGVGLAALGAGGLARELRGRRRAAQWRGSR